MSDLFGTVVNVATSNVGEYLLVDAAIGDNTLLVSNVSTFDEAGGRIIVAGEVYSYWGVDFAASRLLLTTGSGLLLTLAGGAGGVRDVILADEPVEVWPPLPEKKALIDLGVDEGEAVFALVPQTLNAVIQDGFRDEGQRETVLIEQRSVGELYVKDVVAQPPDLPPVEIVLGDGLPPIASPTPVVTGWVGALHAKWQAIEGPDPISYAVHVSTISDFATTPSTLVGTTGGTSFTIRTLQNDSLLVYGVTYYVKVVAYDLDGEAPAGGQDSGQMQPVTGPDIAATYVYAGEVNAAQINGGEITADLLLSGMISTRPGGIGGGVDQDASGIAIYDPAGLLGTTLGPENSVFRGDAEIGGLTVKDAMSVRGVSNELSTSAELLLAAGITAPSTGPAIVQDWESITFTKDGDGSFNPANLTSVSKVGTLWVCGYRGPSGDQYNVYRFNADGSFNSLAADQIISPTATQTVQLVPDGLCFTIASNHTVLRHKAMAANYTHVWTSDFVSNLETARWTNTSGAVWDAADGGVAKLTADSHIRTDYTNVMKDSFVSVKVRRISGTDTQEIFLTLYEQSSGNALAEIKLSGSTLIFRIFDSPLGSGVQFEHSITYNSTTHAYWKISEVDAIGGGGDIHFYTSSDGVSWTERYTNDHDFTVGELSNVRFHFHGHEEGGSGTQVVYIDQVRHGLNNESQAFQFSTLDDDDNPMVLGTDGTSLYIADHDNSGANDRLRVRSITNTTTMVVASTTFSDTNSIMDAPLAGILVGSFDLGASRYVFKRADSNDWWSVNPSNGDWMPAEYFPADNGGSKAIVWDGSNFWGLGGGKLYKHTGLVHASGTATLAFAAASTWFDSNATGGTHETTISPVSALTLKKRSRLTVTAPAIPGAGGPDDPNSVRFYLGLSSGALTLYSTTGAGVHSAVYNSLVVGGAAPPGANNFPGGTPAKIKSTTGGLIISGDGTITGGSFGGAWLPTEIGNAVNLDSLTTAGVYSQTSDAEAAAGSNYPVPYAGFLEVIAAGSIRMQRYTAHRNADLTTAPSVWERFHNGTSWTAWVPLFDDHGTETVVANFCVASANFTISSGTVRLMGKHLSIRINWTRTTSTLGVPGDGNITNTPICQMTAKYRPGTGTDQGGLATGATGRGAAFIIGSDGTITMTWVDGGDTAGGLDIVATDTGSVLGTVLMA